MSLTLRPLFSGPGIWGMVDDGAVVVVMDGDIMILSAVAAVIGNALVVMG